MTIPIESEDLAVYSLTFGFLMAIALNFLVNQISKKFDSQKKETFSKYFLLESFTALVTMFLFLKFSLTWQFLYSLLLVYSLIILSLFDLRYKMVPDYLLVVVLIFAFFATSLPLWEAFKNAFLFAGFFSLLEFLLTFYIQNIKAKITNDESLRTQKALGEGDIPIVATIGAVLGVKAGIVAIFLGSLFAIIPAIYLASKKKERETPFIPFLFLGFLFEFFVNLSTKVFS